MRIILRALSVVVLIISAAWLYFERDFESLSATIVSLSALISTFFFGQKQVDDKGQNQTVGDKSNAIQAGGDVSILIESKSNKDD